MSWWDRWRRREHKSYWELVEPYWEKVSIYEGPETFLAQYHSIPEVSQRLLAAHWAQSEIRNGGFDQFFSNSTGVLGPEAVAGFGALGMTETADLMARVMRCLGDDYPRDYDLRELALDRVYETRGPELDLLNSADPLFWDLLKHEAGGFRAAADRFAAREGER